MKSMTDSEWLDWLDSQEETIKNAVEFLPGDTVAISVDSSPSIIGTISMGFAKINEDTSLYNVKIKSSSKIIPVYDKYLSLIERATPNE